MATIPATSTSRLSLNNRCRPQKLTRSVVHWRQRGKSERMMCHGIETPLKFSFHLSGSSSMNSWRNLRRIRQNSRIFQTFPQTTGWKMIQWDRKTYPAGSGTLEPPSIFSTVDTDLSSVDGSACAAIGPVRLKDPQFKWCSHHLEVHQDLSFFIIALHEETQFEQPSLPRVVVKYSLLLTASGNVGLLAVGGLPQGFPARVKGREPPASLLALACRC